MLMFLGASLSFERPSFPLGKGRDGKGTHGLGISVRDSTFGFRARRLKLDGQDVVALHVYRARRSYAK